MAAIEVRGLERRYSEDVLAVAGIDLEVAEGEIYAFLGPNGAGKTTTVRMLTTLLAPTGGTATVAGFDVVKDAPNVRRSIGVDVVGTQRFEARAAVANGRGNGALRKIGAVQEGVLRALVPAQRAISRPGVMVDSR